MPRLAACCLFLLGCCTLASAADLRQARLRWLKGNYEEAQGQYEELLKDAKLLGPASIGLSRALASQGEYEKALVTIDKALATRPMDADLLTRQAELFYLRGKWDEAVKAANAALAIKDKHLAALWVRAQVYRDRGDIKQAGTEMKRIFGLYNSSVNTADEFKEPEDLLIVGMASAENARWNGLADEFQAILEDLFGDAVKNDRAFWPAEWQAGLLLLEKYNRGEALDAFDKALTINPSAAEVLVARGVAALQRFEVKDAENFAERALKINPLLPEALRLLADVSLTTLDTTTALDKLALARKVNPRDERTLARIAACHLLRGDSKSHDAIVAEVEKFDKVPSTFWFEIGERMEDRRRFDIAERSLLKAAKLRPELAGPANALGMLYMRMGKEVEAATLLDKGFKADRFNVRVSNMRKVLRHLESYKELKTKHFVIKYDEKSDPVLAKYVADQLEVIYEELARKFDYRPTGPIPIEIFRNHDMFSGRTVALPDLHTIGACTGKVITMVSPNEKSAKGEPARKPFNWARVIRHEVVHIFNLAQTNYLVPHWFTEGLAVANEGFPRPPTWNRMLVERVPARRLLTLDTIDLGFIRPRDPMEWQLAYCQANLYIEYIEKTYGPKAIGELLAAFSKGKSTVEALKDVCKVEKAAFEKGYRAHLDELVKTLQGGRASEKRRTLTALQAEYKKNPQDADVCAELALRLVNTRRAEARKYADEALEQKKTHPKALYVLAQLAKRAADTRQEKALLEKAVDRENPEPLVLKALGKLYYDAGDFTRAADLFELGRKADPYDRDWLLELARVYAQTNEATRQISVLRDLVPLDADDLDRRVRLARLLSEQGKHDGAETYARQALEIDVTSKDAREILYKALAAQNKDAELTRVKAILGQ